jgi:YihY family inner membrane protein
MAKIAVSKERYQSQDRKYFQHSIQPKSGGGLFSLALELLVAVAISLMQRSCKAWSSSLLAKLKNPEPRSSRVLSSKTAPKDLTGLSDHRSEISPERAASEKPYQRGIVALFKNTASEWIHDKCPQLGAALAYFTVFSLAPLVLVLLAVFGLIFGGSDQARQKITEQLQYLIDPSGIKVIEDIATNASKPQAGILATTIGVVIALFGASGVFGQLQDALNTIWGVKPKPGGGIWGFIRTRFLSFGMVGGVCFLLLVSLTIESLLKGFSAYLKNVVPGGDIVGLSLFLIFDLVVVVLLFAMIFRYLPDAKIAWRDVWVGATLPQFFSSWASSSLVFTWEAERLAQRMVRPARLSLFCCGSIMRRKSFSLARNLLRSTRPLTAPALSR